MANSNTKKERLTKIKLRSLPKDILIYEIFYTKRIENLYIAMYKILKKQFHSCARRWWDHTGYKGNILDPVCRCFIFDKKTPHNCFEIEKVMYTKKGTIKGVISVSKGEDISIGLTYMRFKKKQRLDFYFSHDERLIQIYKRILEIKKK